jgi:hypothetical protein
MQNIQQEVVKRTNSPTFFTLFENKLKSLQIYDIAQNYRILHRMVQCFQT